MAATEWKLEELKADLRARPSVKGWVITVEHVRRRERYFLLEAGRLGTDQDREAQQENIQLQLFVDVGRPGRQGEITKKLAQGRPLGTQLDAAVAAAAQTDHQAWVLPESAPQNLPEPKSADPRIAEDINGVLTHLTDRMDRAVTDLAGRRSSVFNSAELFVSIHERELHLSNGLVHRHKQSRVYAEAAFSHSRRSSGGKTESDEYLNTAWSVSLDDLPIEKLFEETAERAEWSLDVTKPKSGHYPVIVDAEVLAALFNEQVNQLGAANAYHRLPFAKPGEAWVPGAEGDLLTVRLDPSLDYGADSIALSESGVRQEPLTLVEKNIVQTTATDKRYADYFGRPPTSVRGSIVVGKGTRSLETMIRSAPLVIEVLQFSGLFIDGNTGTFSSEIRLARLHDNGTGKVTYLKGGSLSGSFRENFRKARLSDRAVKQAHFSSNTSKGAGYYGPEHALLSDVSVTG